MPKVLVLFAHPRYEKSRVNRALVTEIRGLPNVTFHDLYERYYHFQVDVAYEQRLLAEHDVIVWHHPFYWYNCPPLLKQWIDLVLEFGWAYGPEGTALEGKACLQVVTTGGSSETYCSQGQNNYSINTFLRPFEQSARLCGMTYLPPFAVTGAHRLREKDLARHGENYRRILTALTEGRSITKLEDCDLQEDVPLLNADKK